MQFCNSSEYISNQRKENAFERFEGIFFVVGITLTNSYLRLVLNLRVGLRLNFEERRLPEKFIEPIFFD